MYESTMFICEPVSGRRRLDDHHAVQVIAKGIGAGLWRFASRNMKAVVTSPAVSLAVATAVSKWASDIEASD